MPASDRQRAERISPFSFQARRGGVLEARASVFMASGFAIIRSQKKARRSGGRLIRALSSLCGLGVLFEDTRRRDQLAFARFHFTRELGHVERLQLLHLGK